MDKEKITGSAPSEYKDNLHGQPLEFYGEKFREADPQEIAARLHLPFQKETGELSVRFLGKTYKISHPDFHITMAEPGMDALSCSDSARILMLRYLCATSVFPAPRLPRESFCPSGICRGETCILSNFRADAFSG